MYNDIYKKLNEKSNHPKVREEPYTISKKSSEIKKRLKSDVDDFERFFGNFIYDHETWTSSKVAEEMDFFYRRRIHQLCKGTVSISIMRVISFG